MKLSDKKVDYSGVVEEQTTVFFDLTDDEEGEYAKAVRLLSKASKQALREAGYERSNLGEGGMISVTSYVHKNQLRVVCRTGMLG
jgi:hypothetical protein